jgi:hypothetical protein
MTAAHRAVTEPSAGFAESMTLVKKRDSVVKRQFIPVGESRFSFIANEIAMKKGMGTIKK